MATPDRARHVKIVRPTLNWLSSMPPVTVGVLALALTAAIATIADAAATLHRPLWLDEVVTQLVAHGPNGILAAMRSGVDFQPPSHYALVAMANDIAGVDALVTRLPSVIAAALTILLLAAMLRTRLSVTAALAGSLALAAHPLFSAQSVEARPYALWILASALTAESLRSGRRFCAWLTGGAAVLLCTSHYFGVLTLAAIGLAVLGHARWARRLSWREAVLSVTPLAAGALALLALLPLARAQLAATSGRSWVAPATAGGIADFLSFTWGWRPALLLIAGGAVLYAVRRIPAVAARWPRENLEACDRVTVALLATAAVPLLVVLVTLTYKPVMVLRYAAPSVLAMATLCALAVEALPRKVRWVPLLLLVRASLFSYQSMATAAHQEMAAFSQESYTIRQLAARGIRTLSPFRHDAYRASFAAQGAPAVAWIDLPDSLLERVGNAGVPSITRNLLLVERDFGRAVKREFRFPAVVSAGEARSGGTVALLRDVATSAADTLWFPGRAACPLSSRLVVFAPLDSAASCGALQAAVQGLAERR